MAENVSIKRLLIRVSCLAFLLFILSPCDGAWGYVGPGPGFYYKKWISAILFFIIPVTFGLLAACCAAIRFVKNQQYSKTFKVIFIGAFVGAFLGGLTSILIMYKSISCWFFPWKELLTANLIQSLFNALFQGLIIGAIRKVYDEEFIYLIPTVLLYTMLAGLILAVIGFVEIVVFWLFPLFYLGVVIWGLQSAYVIWRRGRPVQGL